MVKRAYLDQALRFHPDRQHDSSESAQARAAFRMREVNEAWSVLRNPATRARYDDDLRATSPATAVSPPGPSSAPRPTAGRAATATATDARLGDILRGPEVADLDRDDAAAPPRRRSSPWRTWAPLIIGGLVLVTVLIFTAYAQDDTPSVGVRTVEEFAVGTCVVVGFGPAGATPTPGEQAREQVVAVPCDQVGSQQIVDRVPFPKPCPTGSRPQLLEQTKESLCLR